MKRILILLIILMIAIVGFIIIDAAILTTNKKTDRNDNHHESRDEHHEESDIDIFYNGDTYEDGRVQATINDVESDISFEVISTLMDDDYTGIAFTDILGEEVELAIDVRDGMAKIKALDLLESGKTYKLTLTDQIYFTHKNLVHVKELIINVELEDLYQVSYQETVVEIDSDTVNKTDQADVIIVDKPVEVDEIIFVKGGHENGVSDQYYKVTYVEVTDGAQYVEWVAPTIDEVFESFEISGSYVLDNQAQVTFDTGYMEEQIRESGLIDLLMTKVYAEGEAGGYPDINLDIKGFDGDYWIFDLSITFKDFLGDGTDLTIGMGIKMSVVFNANLVPNSNWDIQGMFRTDLDLILDSDLSVSVSSARPVGDEHTAIINNDMFKGMDNNLQEQIEEVKLDVQDVMNKEQYLLDGFEVKLMDLNMPLAGPVFLSGEIDLFLKNSISLDDMQVNDEIRLYTYFQILLSDNTDLSVTSGAYFNSELGDIELMGSVSSKLGANFRCELEILDTAGIGVEAQLGIKAELKALADINFDADSEIFWKLSMGDYYDIAVIAQIERRFGSDINLSHSFIKESDTYNPWFEIGHYHVPTSISAYNVEPLRMDTLNVMDLTDELRQMLKKVPELEDKVYMNRDIDSSGQVPIIMAQYLDIFDQSYTYEEIDFEDLQLSYDRSLIEIDNQGQISLKALNGASTDVTVTYDGFETTFTVIESNEVVYPYSDYRNIATYHTVIPYGFGDYYKCYVVDENNQLWMWGSVYPEDYNSDTREQVQIMSNVKEVFPGSLNFTGIIDMENNLWILDPNTKQIRKIMDNVMDADLYENDILILSGSGEILKGTVLAFGDQFFDDNTEPYDFLEIESIDNPLSVRLGSEHGLVLDAYGGLWSFGDNEYGQLGVSRLGESERPVLVMDNVIYMDACGKNSLAMTADNNLWIWGSNTKGQIGNNSRTIIDYATVEEDFDSTRYSDPYIVEDHNAREPHLLAENVEYAVLSGPRVFVITKEHELWFCGDNYRDRVDDEYDFYTSEENYQTNLEKFEYEIVNVDCHAYGSVIVVNESGELLAGHNLSLMTTTYPEYTPYEVMFEDVPLPSNY